MISGDHPLHTNQSLSRVIRYRIYFDSSIRLHLTLTALAYVLLSCSPFNFFSSTLQLSWHDMTCEMELVYSYLCFFLFFRLSSLLCLSYLLSILRYLQLACFEIFGLLHVPCLFYSFLSGRGNCILDFASFALLSLVSLSFHGMVYAWE